MDNKFFNDCIVSLSVRKMVERGYAVSEDAALAWLHRLRWYPYFGQDRSMTKLTVHAYRIIVYRRHDKEAELAVSVKAYYKPQFIEERNRRNMEEIIRLLAELNEREHAGASCAEVSERAANIHRLAPAFAAIYWKMWHSWVLVPMDALPEEFQRHERGRITTKDRDAQSLS
jgi:hypothetical protein